MASSMHSDFSARSEENSFRISFKDFTDRHFWVNAQQLVQISDYGKALLNGNFSEVNSVCFEPYNPEQFKEGDDPDDVLRVLECVMRSSHVWPRMIRSRFKFRFFKVYY
jgi:hypothetical protein